MKNVGGNGGNNPAMSVAMEKTRRPINEKADTSRGVIDALRLERRVLGFYERFEAAVAHILSVVISVIIAISLWQLIRAVVALLVLKALNPMDHAVFQTVFGMVMTLLIAMEFKHSIIRVMLRRDHIVQAKTVVLIALLAIARKFIVLDPSTDPARIGALAAALLALGGVYWLMRQRDDPIDAERFAE